MLGASIDRSKKKETSPWGTLTPTESLTLIDTLPDGESNNIGVCVYVSDGHIENKVPHRVSDPLVSVLWILLSRSTFKSEIILNFFNNYNYY